MSFIGEAWRVHDAANIAGTAVPASGFALQTLAAGPAVTISAGDSIAVAVSPDLDRLTSADPVEFTWVVTAASGSAGVDLVEGLDPSWDAVAGTHSLGSRTITAGEPLVVDSEIVTFAALDGYVDAPVLQITCTSGTVTLQQVRMRAWPPGGPVGALRLAPAYTQTQNGAQAVSIGRDSFPVAVSDTTDPNAPQPAAKAIVLGDNTDKLAYLHETADTWIVGSHTETLVNYTETLESASVRFTVDDGYVRAIPSNPIYFNDNATVPHPDTVVGEPTYWIRTATGDPVEQTFQQWTSDVTYISPWPPGVPPPEDPDSISRGMYEAGHVGVQDHPFPEPSSGPTSSPGAVYTYDVAPAIASAAAPTAVAAGASPTTVPLSSLVSTAEFRAWSTPPGWAAGITAVPTDEDAPTVSSGIGGAQLSFSFFSYLAEVPAHYVWDPAATTEIPMRIRQRGDGLGMGAPRVRGTASRQRSTRVRGHY